jgi:hypothetical protein
MNDRRTALPWQHSRAGRGGPHGHATTETVGGAHDGPGSDGPGDRDRAGETTRRPVPEHRRDGRRRTERHHRPRRQQQPTSAGPVRLGADPSPSNHRRHTAARGHAVQCTSVLVLRAAAATAPAGIDFTGTYRADYGPGTDLEGKPASGAPATTSTWGVRSTCGAAGCVATASNVSGNGMVLLSSMVFDQVAGSWLAVGLASADCNGPTELFVVFTLQPRPDGTLSGETTRAASNSGCVVKRTVTFTRTGDPDVNRVPDPAVLPPRTVSPAQALHGRYQAAARRTSPSPPSIRCRTGWTIRSRCSPAAARRT